MKTRTTSRKTFREILRYLKPYAALLFCTVLLAAATVAGQLAVPYFVGKAIDKIVGVGNVDFAGLMQLFAVIGGCIAGGALAQWLMSLCNNRVCYHVLADVRRDAFRKIERLLLHRI